jgi:hypothetical protein
MKTKHALFALALTLGTVISAFAGNNPAIPPGPGVPLSDIKVGREVGPKWDRKTIVIADSIVEVGAWYRTCPVMPNVILNPKTSTEVQLSNGKRIMLSCGNCKDSVEKDLAKYKVYMY